MSRTWPGFPKLKHWEQTSRESPRYNCIAWAAGDSHNRWWPRVPGTGGALYWPAGVPHVRELAAFVEAFRTVGYESCADGALEPGLEKVAIYAHVKGPTHAARQLADGRWTSKLGGDIDITHDSVGDLEDGEYGRVVQYMCRERLAIRPAPKPPD